MSWSLFYFHWFFNLQIVYTSTLSVIPTTQSTRLTMNLLPTAYLSSLKQYVVDASSSLTQTKPIQNVKDTVSSTVVSTKDYFYPKPEEHEMRSVVRLDGAFLAEQDIVEYTTPGQAFSPPHSPSAVQSPHSQIPSNIIIEPVKPSGDALTVQSWHDCGIHCICTVSLYDQTCCLSAYYLYIIPWRYRFILSIVLNTPHVLYIAVVVQGYSAVTVTFTTVIRMCWCTHMIPYKIVYSPFFSFFAVWTICFWTKSANYRKLSQIQVLKWQIHDH